MEFKFERDVLDIVEKAVVAATMAMAASACAVD
jgi:hypothetical protein